MEEHRMLRYFAYEQLPPRLQVASRPFCELARRLINGDLAATITDEVERDRALESLLDAKDRAVRSIL